MHNCGFYARYGRDLYFVSRDLTALSEQLKKYDFRLGVVEVVGSNPAGPIFIFTNENIGFSVGCLKAFGRLTPNRFSGSFPVTSF